MRFKYHFIIMGWENVQKTAKIIQNLILPDFQQFLDVFLVQGGRLESCLHLKMSIKVILYFYGDRIKNAAKRSRQHAGKRYWEYAQRRVCFVNEQVPSPHPNINVKFYTSRLCMKMSSFLFVRSWAMPGILYLSCGVPFPV